GDRACRPGRGQMPTPTAPLSARRPDSALLARVGPKGPCAKPTFAVHDRHGLQIGPAARVLPPEDGTALIQSSGRLTGGQDQRHAGEVFPDRNSSSLSMSPDKPALRARTHGHLTRRSFLWTSSTAAAGLMIVPRHVIAGGGAPAPSDRLNIAGIGVGGMGAADISAVAPGHNLVALCDVDLRRAGDTLKKFPGARQFRD